MTVEAVYHRLAPVYDLLYGALLQPGRRRAMARLAPKSGESILEVGVGTGFGLRAYPRGCRVVAIDVSEPMIARACARLQRHRIEHVALCRMDAAQLAFGDATFDAVYAPYVINVVSDPIRAAREMLRACRPGGRLVLLNHFDRVDRSPDAVQQVVGRLASRVSRVNWHLDYETFVRESGLAVQSVEAVNFANVSCVVLCGKP
jgi:phosphatidylethanolamine/phosphatidyl-N-methylethanolamine N-methyltransferase